MDRGAAYRFETFVVGSANRLAVAAARAVAQSPGTAYNPLFIYSGSGLGKTHLLVAAGQLARQLQPQLTVCYAIVDDLVEQLHTAVASGELERFRQRYQGVDVLLLDDVQFLAGRQETQSEILRLFNVLQRSGRQIVLACDRPPAEIADLDERLITRFSGGLIVDIGPPDYETRAAILRRKCAERDLAFDTGVVEELARIPFTNVRELQGALNRLIASQTLGEQRVTVENVHTLLGERVSTGEYLALARAMPVSEGDEFASFLTELAEAVAENVEPWRVRLGEAMTRWHAAGYRTGALERALAANAVPDIDTLLQRFEASVERLRLIAREVAAIDAGAASSELFRDPDRVADAERLLARLSGVQPPAGPSAAFTRDSFEVGPSNQLAAHAADELVAEPGRLYNPFYVHGPAGCGKTHLVSAIGNELNAVCGGAMRVAYVQAGAFADELIAALEAGGVEEWRARYRGVDALVIDDVQLLGGKERTQEELFHLFNALHQDGKQMVLAGDRPPRALSDVEERLRSRFEGGLVAEIQPPDRALRERLYARFLTAAGAIPERPLLEFLGARPADSARDIASVVDRLVAASALGGAPLTAKFARQELTGSRSPAAMAAASGRTVDSFFLDTEKVIWDWPDVSGRAIEELR